MRSKVQFSLWSRAFYSRLQVDAAVILLLIHLLLLQGCGDRKILRGPGTPDYWPTNSWQEATPESQGIDSDALARALKYAREAELNLHSVLLVRHGYIVLDATFYPYDGNTPHDIASVTKSVTSTLVGAAIAGGHLTDADQKLIDVLGKRAQFDDDLLKAQITLGHLLSMSSGFDCGYRPAEAELTEMMAAPNWVRFALALPMLSRPGERFGYCSPGMHLLSAVLTEATGLSERDFAEQALFKPLGIVSGAWPRDPQGVNHGWGDLRLRPRDMAKIGFLALHNGRWDGGQVVSEGWIANASQPHIAVPDQGKEVNYGYGWWLLAGDFEGVFEAQGRGGQYITIWPQQDLVLVLTGGGYDRTEFILRLAKAIGPSGPLPASPIAQQRLRAAAEGLLRAPSASNPGDPPPLAAQISGRDYKFDANAIGFRSLRLDLNEDQQQARFSFNLTSALAPEAEGKYAMALGLDGRYRFNKNGPRGYRVGLRGRWLEDRRFELRYAETAGPNQFNFTFHFEGDEVNVVFEDLSGLYGRHLLRGRVVE